ncbi:MAG: hypothetical protein H6662_14260 [Ardenticatenaceae bacterium]|nr:hypothetical protein [Anaerolineales bacterium]MCB8922747.1 hypothetical protein [Ardenticatenaceae bacterium]
MTKTIFNYSLDIISYNNCCPLPSTGGEGKLPSFLTTFCTTPPGTASLRVGLAASVDNDVADGWLLANRVKATAS